MYARSIARLAAFVALFGAIAHPVRGQSVGRMLVTDVRNSVGDMWDVWTSPFRARPSDWLMAAAAVGLSAAVSPFDDNVDRWAARNRDNNTFHVLKPFREGGVAFSGQTITPVAGGLLGLGLAMKNETIQEGLLPSGKKLPTVRGAAPSVRARARGRGITTTAASSFRPVPRE